MCFPVSFNRLLTIVMLRFGLILIFILVISRERIEPLHAKKSAPCFSLRESERADGADGADVLGGVW